jgi:hypothetical protein
LSLRPASGAVPFKFNGKVDKLTIAPDQPKLTAEQVNELVKAQRAAQEAN